MSTVKALSNRADKLERQRKVHIRFELIEENYPGDEFWPACEFALVRNDEPVFRFPKKLTIDEWQSKYSQPNP